ncbi:MAG: 1,4-dihydroxy-2-naphthoate polyprenyltransferase [Turicibacter sp.]|nr:1,4-dihydroxy-2-naphthoate polyprenyltransferase [Turicibacter sp.]
MNLTHFLQLVEIKTKIASVFPFLIGLFFTLYRYETLNVKATFVFFAAMLIFDLTTTSINNFLDYRKSDDDAYRQDVNIIGSAGLNEKTVLFVILAMLTVATGLGLYLVSLTSWLVLLIGALCFAIGIFYTFGPIPLSRLPLGEIFSGVTMGFGILFLTVYVNTHQLGYLAVNISQGILSIQLSVPEMLTLLLVSLPSIFTIANLMLANNICDLEEDVKNNRYTLVYYIGKKRAVVLFHVLYACSFLSILVCVLLGIHNAWMLIALIVLPLVLKGLAKFRQEQVKSRTFVVAVRNLVLIDGILIIGLSISNISRFFS